MRREILLVAMASTATQSMGAAYKIPEQSVNSTALSGAYVANASGADASYYNPAAMVYNPEGATLEADLTYLHLSSISVENYSPAFGDDSTKTENFLLPTFHYVSPKVGKTRFGLSVIIPAGLTKRWKGVNQAFVRDFTLKTVEINPTIGYQLSDRLSIGGGLRALYSDGKVKSSDTASPFVPIGREMTGDSWDFGYNLALQFKASEALDLALTYRSKIDMTVTGDATLFGRLGPFTPTIDSNAKVTIPLPAALNLAAAYTFNRKTTVELVYERTYWSSYEKLDFKYGQQIPSPPYGAFDNPSEKNWEDSNTFRIGVTHLLNDKWTLMGGFAYDKTPVKEKYVDFILPDSDAKIFSLGARYNYSDALSFGAGFLYDKKDTRKIDPGTNINTGLESGAKFKDASAYLLTVGVNYDF